MPRHQCLIYEDSPTKHLISLSSLIRQNLEESCRHPGDSGAFLGCFPSRQGRFDADRMIRMLADTVEHTPANGHTGLFATGDMNWESGEQGDFGNPLSMNARLKNFFAGRRNCETCANTVSIPCPAKCCPRWAPHAREHVHQRNPRPHKPLLFARQRGK